MGFIGSTSYYVLCVIALVILVSALIILQTKPKPHPKNTKTDYQKPPSEHIPKYAAGDDMDQINRKAYALWSEKKVPQRKYQSLSLGHWYYAVSFYQNLTKPKQHHNHPSPLLRHSRLLL